MNGRLKKTTTCTPVRGLTGLYHDLKRLQEVFFRPQEKGVDLTVLARSFHVLTGRELLIADGEGKVMALASPRETGSLVKITEDGRVIKEDWREKIFYLEECCEERIEEAGRDYWLGMRVIRGWKENLAILITAGSRQSTTEEKILLEFVAAMAALEVLHRRQEKDAQQEQERERLRQALDVLSFCEREAVKKIFQDQKKKDLFLVASSFARENNFTRSTVVNALRKLESAGIITTRSRGVKGTHVRVMVENFFSELQKW